MNRLFLDALERKNQHRPPVWIMRQAGRYLPSYQALRKKHSLYELFFTPELAAEVTLLPVQELGVDAAILFSDITVIARACGLSLEFQEGVGPVIAPRIEAVSQLGPSSMDALEPIRKAVHIAKKQLAVPLIGFCGGPFTVASYLIEKNHRQDLPLTKRWMMGRAAEFHHLLERLTEVTIAYLDLQIDAGVEAIQIFDSWAHVLSLPDLEAVCLPYHERLIRHVQSRRIPALSFMRSSTLHVKEIAAMKPDAISFDWQRPLASMRNSLGQDIAIQGNLDPDILFAPPAVIEKRVQELLVSLHADPAFIVNLGHGVKPDTPWQAVRQLIDIVKAFKPDLKTNRSSEKLKK